MSEASKNTQPDDQPELTPRIVRGKVQGRDRVKAELPTKGEVKRYILTSAQNNTHILEGLWVNLLALSSHYDAQLLVGTYSYNKAAYGRKAVKRGTINPEDKEDVWYDEQLTEHIVDHTVDLAPHLVWCGELNIIPTAMDPLSSMESFNGRQSNIIPHAKFAMRAIPGLDGEGTKHNYTSGTVTQRNYIQKKTGLLAEQYHGYGALIVEVCSDGTWFVRQLQATEEGTIRDFDLKAENGKVTKNNPILAASWGDVHVRVIDEQVRDTIWAEGGMIDALRPQYQFLHDVLDQNARNHHEVKDPVKMFQRYADKVESVEEEIAEVEEFLHDFADRDFCTSVIVPSNHHEALEKWVKEADWKKDPVNAKFYLEAATALLEGENDLFAWGVARAARPGAWQNRITFLETDEPFVLAGVEMGQHGHLGLNGARGNHRSFAKLGRPAVTGHEHSAGIHLWNFVNGTCTKLRVSYNRGPSSWSHSHTLLYPEGTRTIVTMWQGRYRA